MAIWEIEAKESYNPNKGASLSSWTYTIMYYKCLNYCRRHATTSNQDKDNVSYDDTINDTPVVDNHATIDNSYDTINIIRHAPKQYKKLLYDLYVNKIPEGTLAQICNTTVRDIENRKRRAINHIRKKLKRLDKKSKV